MSVTCESRWFSPGTLVSSTNKTDHHDITEILLKVALNTITINFLLNKQSLWLLCLFLRLSLTLRRNFTMYITHTQKKQCKAWAISEFAQTFYRPSKNFDCAKQTTLTKKPLSDLADSVIFGRHENLLEFFKLCTLQLYITHNGSWPGFLLYNLTAQPSGKHHISISWECCEHVCWLNTGHRHQYPALYKIKLDRDLTSIKYIKSVKLVNYE